MGNKFRLFIFTIFWALLAKGQMDAFAHTDLVLGNVWLCPKDYPANIPALIVSIIIEIIYMAGMLLVPRWIILKSKQLNGKLKNKISRKHFYLCWIPSWLLIFAADSMNGAFGECLQLNGSQSGSIHLITFTLVTFYLHRLLK
jgi:hypothetical protein